MAATGRSGFVRSEALFTLAEPSPALFLRSPVCSLLSRFRRPRRTRLPKVVTSAIVERAQEGSLVADMRSEVGVRVVAEGLEQQAERDKLASMGCNIAQGHLFSPLLPDDDFRIAASYAAVPSEAPLPGSELFQQTSDLIEGCSEDSSDRRERASGTITNEEISR
jgi:hypothetical protein